MSAKSQKLIGVGVAVWLCILFANCSAPNSAITPTFPNTATVERELHNRNAPVNNEHKPDKFSNTNSSRAINCSNQNEYNFVVVENPDRKIVPEMMMPKDLNIVIGEEVVSKIELPNSEAKNFSLNSVKRTKSGFEIKVEWGGGNYHYEIQFNFNCQENNLYLYKVKNENFSTTNPDSGNLLDKKETEVTSVEPNLPIEKFVMLDYLQ